MGRRRKAWLPRGNGRLQQRGRVLPGYYVLWNDYTPDGRRIRRSKNFLTSKAAREWFKQRNAREDLNAIGDVIPTPYPEAIREFLTGCTTLSRDTKIQYTSTLSMFRVIVEDKLVHDINGSDIDKFIAWRMKQSSEATVAKHVRNLRRFFNWSITRSLTDQNPLKQATSLPTDKTVREKPYITEEQLDKLIHALDSQDRKLAAQLAATTGLDRSVVVNLTAQQVDLVQRCIRIQRPKTRRRRPETLIIPLPWKRSPKSEPEVHRKLSHLVAKNTVLERVVQSPL